MPLPSHNIDELHSLKVDGFYPDTRKEEVWDFFQKCGRIGDVYLPRDHDTQKNRGFAFVRFFDKKDAEMCVQDMDGQMFQGSKLRVNFAQVARGPETRSSGRRGRKSSSPSYRRGRRERSRSRSDRRRGRSRSRHKGNKLRSKRHGSQSSRSDSRR
mmetsp:Transcript_59699/g.94524  ORF Transcript_59699/g.94524 Transcript_59699/m.94524 type:complete len:156 (-) Transcript_59699:88-555(-)